MHADKLGEVVSRSWPVRYAPLVVAVAASGLVTLKAIETAAEVIPDWLGFAHYLSQYLVLVLGAEKTRRYLRNLPARRASLSWRKKDARDFSVLTASLITLWLPWHIGAPVGVALAAIGYYLEVYKAEMELNRPNLTSDGNDTHRHA